MKGPKLASVLAVVGVALALAGCKHQNGQPPDTDSNAPGGYRVQAHALSGPGVSLEHGQGHYGSQYGTTPAGPRSGEQSGPLR